FSGVLPGKNPASRCFPAPHLSSAAKPRCAIRHFALLVQTRRESLPAKAPLRRGRPCSVRSTATHRSPPAAAPNREPARPSAVHHAPATGWRSVTATSPLAGYGESNGSRPLGLSRKGQVAAQANLRAAST